MVEHASLVEYKFFSTASAVEDFVRNNPGSRWEVVDSLGQALPHFFSDAPMYCMRHRSSGLWGDWYPSPGHCRRRFATFPGRYDDLNVEMRNPKLWEVVDHRKRVVRPGLTYNPHVPDQPGLYGIGRVVGSLEYLFEKSDGPKDMRCWFKNLKALKNWVGGNGQCMVVKIRGRSRVLKPAPGLFVVRTLGNGEYERLGEIDPFC
jgi:hypothetical protein